MKQVPLAALVISVFAATNAWSTVSPEQGGPMPKAYHDTKRTHKNAFEMDRAWIQKTRRIREKREAFLKANGPMMAHELPDEYKVTGTLALPVLLGQYPNRTTTVTRAQLDNRLFTSPSGTVTDYYTEVSYGNVTMLGTVTDWSTLANVDTYYEGGVSGLIPAFARTGEFIKEVLDANDGALDFGQFDNDGPDGQPNSGDDDGFVDFVAFVHNEPGGECTNGGNMWSHTWVYTGWNASGGLPYATNDARFGGGNILVNSYTIQPAVNCPSAGGGLIDIGVYCHEFGHAFGLPDLYDVDGGGQGIGWWGIMGSGNWNSPSSPAHPCAWTRQELGYLVPIDVTWQQMNYNIQDINTNPSASSTNTPRVRDAEPEPLPPLLPSPPLATSSSTCMIKRPFWTRFWSKPTARRFSISQYSSCGFSDGDWCQPSTYVSKPVE